MRYNTTSFATRLFWTKKKHISFEIKLDLPLTPSSSSSAWLTQAKTKTYNLSDLLSPRRSRLGGRRRLLHPVPEPGAWQGSWRLHIWCHHTAKSKPPSQEATHYCTVHVLHRLTGFALDTLLSNFPLGTDMLELKRKSVSYLWGLLECVEKWILN